MNKKIFVVLDLETTGLSHTSDGITEVVALAYREDGSYSHCVINELTHPKKEIPKIVVDITGITNTMVKYRRSFKRVLYELNKKLEELIELGNDVILVAHNATFEKKFLDNYWGAFKKYDYIDTRATHLFLCDGDTTKNNFTRNYSKLKQACAKFGIHYDEGKAHRAEYDVLVTAKVLQKHRDKLSDKELLLISKQYIHGDIKRTKEKDRKREIDENQIKWTL